MSPHDHEHDHHAHDHEGHDHDDGREPDESTAEEAQRDAERELRKRIALSQVRQYGDPVLRMRANEVEVFDAEGVGLAATQVGVARRFFVFEHDGVDGVLVNPVITKSGGEPELDEEGCLSLGTVRVPVERRTEVVIEGKNAAGEDVRYEFEGMPARVVQHELDHLDGVLILDRTDAASRKEALGKLRPRLLLSTR